METKFIAKNFAYNFFNGFEVKSINFAMKKYYKWKLAHYCSKETDYLSLNYKNEIIRYWSKYNKKPKLNWHKYYSSRNGICDVRYIPDDLYYTTIDQHFNNRKYSYGLMDKNYFTLLFPSVNQPVIVIRKINGIFYDSQFKLIDDKKAFAKCKEKTQIVVKPAVGTGGGNGIVFWDRNEGFEKLKNTLFSGEKNYVVQEIIVQHESLKKIHPSSVNTVRLITLLFKGKVHILSTVFRMGINGSRVDNASAGGITCGIKENGQLKNVAYSGRGIRYEKHPQGFSFSECVVPSFDKIRDLVSEQQQKMANFRMISWDIAVGEDGEPILIEANLRLGELGFHQLNNGPLFGDLTDEVLEEVFGKKEEKGSCSGSVGR